MRLWLKAVRESKGWSQTLTVQKLGITRQSYNFIENGERQFQSTHPRGVRQTDPKHKHQQIFLSIVVSALIAGDFIRYVFYFMRKNKC
ncbi:MAG: helix-turn-helix transcriptional regulator [Acidaminococcaceae bacterium]